MRAHGLSLVLLPGLAFLAAPASAVTIDWVLVGEPGNPSDPLCNCGAVGGIYQISKYEVTNAQYAEFLNAKAASDPLALYNPDMGTTTWGGITRSGSPGSFAYAAKPGWENRPVVYVSSYDALRFSNWLHNGQGSGDTETGAYTLLGGTAIPSNGLTVPRNPGAITFLPSRNEWRKAAYYGGDGLYFLFATGSDTPPACVLPSGDTGNAANCWPATSPGGAVMEVGAYALSESPSGTFDQAGNVSEWTEAAGPWRLQGGGWGSLTGGEAATDPAFEGPAVGFRVASLPEPGTITLVMAGLAGLSVRRRRPAKRP